MAGTKVESVGERKTMFGNGGEQTRMRSVAARTMLRENNSVRMKLTERGFELIAEGASNPVVCESWPRAKRVLQKLGASERNMQEISARLSEGREVVVRMKA
jgi:hypothetical protein